MTTSARLLAALGAGIAVAAFGAFLAMQFDYGRALVLVPMGAGVPIAEALLLRRERRERA